MGNTSCLAEAAALKYDGVVPAIEQGSLDVGSSNLLEGNIFNRLEEQEINSVPLMEIYVPLSGARTRSIHDHGGPLEFSHLITTWFCGLELQQEQACLQIIKLLWRQNIS